MEKVGNCKYKLYIECTGISNCNKCGWNLAVEQKRKKKLRNRGLTTRKNRKV